MKTPPQPSPLTGREPKRGKTCETCQLRIGISCVCGLELKRETGSELRLDVTPVDRIPKRLQYDPQLGKRFDSRSEIKTYIRKQNEQAGHKKYRVD